MPTKIEWATETWNPVTGCTPVSVGCENCYAKRMAKRLRGRYGYPKDDPFKVTLHPERLDQPYRWRRKPRMIFVSSMGDLFHKDVPVSMLNLIFRVFERCYHYRPDHRFLLLTKRPARMARYIREHINYESAVVQWDKSNIWLGVTVESSKYLYRIDELLKVDASVIFVSYEPALGPLVLPPDFLDRGNRAWVVCGGETGPGARPMHPDWARGIRDQCKEAGVPYFHKQNGMWIPVDTVGDDPDPQGRSAMAYKDGTVDLNWQPGPKCIGAQPLWRVTKKEQAGRLLDGKIHSELPEVQDEN